MKLCKFFLLNVTMWNIWFMIVSYFSDIKEIIQCTRWFGEHCNEVTPSASQLLSRRRVALWGPHTCCITLANGSQAARSGLVHT